MKSKGLLLLILLSLCLVFTACGEKQPPASGPQTNEQPQTNNQPETTEPAVDLDQELIFLTGTDYSTFDPHYSVGNDVEMITKNMFNYLVKRDFNNNMEIVPDLAESWEVSDDGLTWTFHLREGVKFHDGTPFTAEAVKVTFERLLDPDNGCPNRSVLAAISEINIINDYTIDLVSEAPSGNFLAQLTHPVSVILCPTTLEQYGKDFATHPVGTGPFKFVEWQAGTHAILERNEDYFEGAPTIARIIWRIVPDPTTRALLIEAGDADIARNLDSSDIERLQNNPNVEVDISPTILAMQVQLNISKDGPLQDIRVRQALNYATDNQSIIDNVLGGIAEPADSPMSSMVWGYTPIGNYPYDPDKAKELLKEAGYEDGINLEMWHSVGRYQMTTQCVEVLQAQWAKVGINVSLTSFEHPAMIAIATNGEDGPFDLIYTGWSPSNVDGGRALDTLMTSERTYNYGRYSDAKFDDLCMQAKVETDLVARAELFKEAQQIAMDGAPWVFLWIAGQATAYGSNISGLQIQPTEHVLLKDVVKTPR